MVSGIPLSWALEPQSSVLKLMRSLGPLMDGLQAWFIQAWQVFKYISYCYIYKYIHTLTNIQSHPNTLCRIMLRKTSPAP